jgi:hypothetical protein
MRFPYGALYLMMTVAASVLFVVGCGDDDGMEMLDAGEIDAGDGQMDAGDGEPDAGDGEPDAGDGEPDAGDGESDAGGGGQAPMITKVAWEPVGDCSTGTESDHEITVTVEDDSPTDQLTFSGSVTSCTGNLDAAVSTVTCPQAAPYNGEVTVADPDGNEDMATFTFGPCETGEMTF